MNATQFLPFAAGTLSLLLVPAPQSFAQATATTAPMGCLQISCLSNSDTLAAVPFNRPAAFTGSVASVSGNVVSFTTSPGFTARQFVYNPSGSPAVTDHFFLRIGPTSTSLTGTIAVTQNSATVTGTGTAFTTQLVVGDRLAISDGTNTINFTVAAIASNTSLTLDRAFTDASAGATTGLVARYDHSPCEGHWYMVTANDASTITLDLNGDTLSSVAANTQVSVVPYWTLGTLYPAANAGTSFTASTSTHSLNTEVLIPNCSASGINIASAAIYYFISNGGNVGWRLFGDSITTDHSNDYLLPDSYFTVRQANGSPTVALTFLGAVPMDRLATPLATSSTQAQDNPIGLNRPVNVALNSLGLNAADGSFVSTVSTHALKDELFVYNDSSVAINKPASAIYYYINNGSNIGWRLFGDSITTDHGMDTITAASALTIRKAATNGGQSMVWSNNPNY